MWLWMMFAMAEDEAGWLTESGPAGLSWGTDSVPFDGVPRRRDLLLIDSDYLGANKADRPEDLELPAPTGERRIVRYAHGALVDAWWVSEKPLEPGPLVGWAKPEWTGVILGPGEDGFLAYGVASSWTVGDRTVLHWRDKEGKRDVIAARAVPSTLYGITRPAPLKPRGDTGAKASIKGSFKEAAKPLRGELASCLDGTRTPVEMTIELRLDKRGTPSRLKVNSEQPVFSLDDCVAGALLSLQGVPGATGDLVVFRMK